MEITKGFGVIGFSLILLVFLLLFVYICYRAGSAFFLTDRIWSIFSAEKNFHNSVIEGEWEKIRSVESFIYRTRIKVNNADEIDKLLNTANLNKIPFIEIVKVGRFFDANKFELKKSNYKIKTGLYFILFLIFYFSTNAPGYFFPNYGTAAYISFKSSEKSFLLFENHALIQGVRIDKNNCKTMSEKELEIKDSELNALCKELEFNEGDTFERNVRLQKASAFVFFSIVCLGIFFSSRRLISSAYAIDYGNKFSKINIISTNDSRSKDEDYLKNLYNEIDKNKLE